MNLKDKNSKNGATSLNKKDLEKKKVMQAFEIALAKVMTKTDLDPLGAAAVLLKLALTVYNDQLKDKYAVEEVIFHALKTIDGDWFDEQNDVIEEMMSDLYRGDKTLH